MVALSKDGACPRVARHCIDFLSHGLSKTHIKDRGIQNIHTYILAYAVSPQPGRKEGSTIPGCCRKDGNRAAAQLGKK